MLLPPDWSGVAPSFVLLPVPTVPSSFSPLVMSTCTRPCVLVPLVPCLTVKLAGDAESEKFGAAAAFTVSEIVVE